MSDVALRSESPRGPGLSLRVVGRLLANLARIARDLVVAPFAARAPRDWVVLRLDRGLVEAPSAPRWLASFTPLPLDLLSVLECLERVESDFAVRGVLVRMGRAPLGWSKVHSIGRALESVRARGKRVVVYAENAGNAGAWLGSLADCFWLAPQGRLDLIGVRLESPFVRGALERFQVRPLVIQAGRYKSAGEILERDSMSDASREALDAVVADLYATLLSALERRAGSPETAARWIDEGPYLGVEARDAGIVDALFYPDELRARLVALERGGDARTAPEPSAPKADLVSADVYLRLTRPRFTWRPLVGPASEIAVVPLQGTILGGNARALVRQLRAIGESDRVAAVVLRIDSPGGEPGAADSIWHAVKQLREKKPVVASMGDSAASGGYYAAMAAHAIVAEPTTLTGSIGVVLASIELDRTLSALGVQFDGVQRGRNAGIFNATRTRSAGERAVLQRHVDLIYRDFLAKAAEGRGLAAEQIEELAEGRVWTGAAAEKHRLVDEMGSLATAVARARALAGLAPGEGEPVYLAPTGAGLRRWLSDGDREAGLAADADDPLFPGAWLWCPIRARLS
jgi:protease IV